MIACVVPFSLSLIAAYRFRVSCSLLSIISARFLLNLRMLKSEDQEYKSQHLTADPACASNSVSNGFSFGILTGVDGLVDQFELDDARNRGDASIVMQKTAWGATRRWQTPLPAD